MKLYHYSDKQFDEVKSRTAINNTRTGPGICDSNAISFFLEPIPRDLPTIFGGKHQLWVKGKSLYEYTVDTQSFPKDIPFHLTESDEKTKLILSQNWDENIPIHKTGEYLAEISRLEIKEGLLGRGLLQLESKVIKYNHGIRDYYINSIELTKGLNDEDEIYTKYAAYVPHLIIYPWKTPIPVIDRQLIVLE